MARISFAITILVFFNPFTKLWLEITDKPLAIRTRLLGFLINLDIPYAGIVLLFLYVILCWAVLSALLWTLEKLVGGMKSTQRLEVPIRNFRNQALHTKSPFFIFWPELVAKYVFWFFLGKFLVVKAMQLLLLTGLPAILSTLFMTYLGVSSINLTQLLTSWISSLIGSLTAQGLEVMLVTVSFLMLLLRRFFLLEADIRHFMDIRHVQVMKRPQAH